MAINYDVHLSLLAENYIRWRHGLVGTADQDVFERTAQALTNAVGQDVSLMSDAELLAYVRGGVSGSKVWANSTHYPDPVTPLQGNSTEFITGKPETDSLVPSSPRRGKKGEGN